MGRFTYDSPPPTQQCSDFRTNPTHKDYISAQTSKSNEEPLAHPRSACFPFFALPRKRMHEAPPVCSMAEHYRISKDATQAWSSATHGFVNGSRVGNAASAVGGGGGGMRAEHQYDSLLASLAAGGNRDFK